MTLEIVEVIKELGFPFAICLFLLFQSNRTNDQKHSMIELMIKQLSVIEHSIKRDINLVQEKIMVLEQLVIERKMEDTRLIQNISQKVQAISARQFEIIGSMNIDISKHTRPEKENEIAENKNSAKQNERGLHENT